MKYHEAALARLNKHIPACVKQGFSRRGGPHIRNKQEAEVRC